MIVSIISLSIALLISLMLNYRLFNINLDLINEKNELTKAKTKAESVKNDLIAIEPGDRVIYPDYRLVYGQGSKDEHTFSGTYELEIIEVSEKQLKVKAIGFTTDDRKTSSDQQRMSGVIQYMQNKWVDRKNVQLIVDDAHKRNAKLKELGIE
jgi:hypothetical protein